MTRYSFVAFRTFFIIIVIVTFSACADKSVKKGMLVATEAPENIKNPDFSNGNSWRYITGSRLVAVSPQNPGSGRLLTESFYSACFPEISYDGKSMIFTAQEKEGDIWQIWEMNLKNLKSRKITSSDQNCTDPFYLPGERLGFSNLTVNDTVTAVHCLYVCNLDGTDLRQVTFSPENYFATTVLKDGRLLAIRTAGNSDNKIPILVVMRPDGTKADRFYGDSIITGFIGSPCETTDGRVVFAESTKTSGDDKIAVSINYNRPLFSRLVLSNGMSGEFVHLLSLKAGGFMASYRKSGSELTCLYEFYPEKNDLGQKILSDAGFNVVDAVEVVEYERPKKLPSEVDMGVKTGLLLCQDINLLAPADAGKLSAHPGARKIEVLGNDTTYGVVSVEEDGSFYLKVMADTPFRLRTLDEQGNVINGPCSWLWLRPNERRGCVGCHQDPELAPENRVSHAVKKSPVKIPVHITKVTEKIVELE